MEQTSIVGLIKKVVEEEIKKINFAEIGIVTSIFPHSNADDNDNYECNVKLRDSGLELRKVPVATQQIGLANIPNVGDLVLVSFIKGDINAPVITGRLYNDEDRPPANNDKEIIYVPPNKSNPGKIHVKFPSGVSFKIDDKGITIKAGKTKIMVENNGNMVINSNAKLNQISEGAMLLCSKEATRLAMGDPKSGDVKSFVSLEEDKTIQIVSMNKDINIETPQGGKIILRAKQNNIEIEAPLGDIVIKGKNIKIESTAEMEIKSNATAKISANANLDIKGAIVNIN
ncbi:MAG: hypothetical protein CVT89_00050 [Candidatus Altiarchaeales archaeon HGW-Altiarchaeales-2]|nr:MAG: hypothetical protein CVT89_00050 [Candidatus Altiarchaeales archaeon HGW-Altiarchaeales-2]